MFAKRDFPDHRKSGPMSWHKEELDLREERIAKGKDSFRDWKEVKSELSAFIHDRENRLTQKDNTGGDTLP